MVGVPGFGPAAAFLRMAAVVLAPQMAWMRRIVSSAVSGAVSCALT